MKRRIVAERLATHLFTTEEAVDTTLALMGDLIAAMPRADSRRVSRPASVNRPSTACWKPLRAWPAPAAR